VLVARAVLRGMGQVPGPGGEVRGSVQVGQMSLLRQVLLPVQAYFRIDFWQLW
jgi:hypothetical protein